MFHRLTQRAVRLATSRGGDSAGLLGSLTAHLVLKVPFPNNLSVPSFVTVPPPPSDDASSVWDLIEASLEAKQELPKEIFESPMLHLQRIPPLDEEGGGLDYTHALIEFMALHRSVRPDYLQPILASPTASPLLLKRSETSVSDLTFSQLFLGVLRFHGDGDGAFRATSLSCMLPRVWNILHGIRVSGYLLCAMAEGLLRTHRSEVEEWFLTKLNVAALSASDAVPLLKLCGEFEEGAAAVFKNLANLAVTQQHEDTPSSSSVLEVMTPYFRPAVLLVCRYEWWDNELAQRDTIERFPQYSSVSSDDSNRLPANVLTQIITKFFTTEAMCCLRSYRIHINGEERTSFSDIARIMLQPVLEGAGMTFPMECQVDVLKALTQTMKETEVVITEKREVIYTQILQHPNLTRDLIQVVLCLRLEKTEEMSHQAEEAIERVCASSSDLSYLIKGCCDNLLSDESTFGVLLRVVRNRWRKLSMASTSHGESFFLVHSIQFLKYIGPDHFDEATARLVLGQVKERVNGVDDALRLMQSLGLREPVEEAVTLRIFPPGDELTSARRHVLSVFEREALSGSVSLGQAARMMEIARSRHDAKVYAKCVERLGTLLEVQSDDIAVSEELRRKDLTAPPPSKLKASKGEGRKVYEW